MPDLIERIGDPGVDQVSQYLHVRANDRFSGGAETYLKDAIRVQADGSRTYSTERWFRFRFLPPFGYIADFRLWCPGLVVPPTWTLLYGVTDEYRRPSRNASSIATSELPTSRPEAPNVGGWELMDGSETRWSNWVVLQASADGTTPAGALADVITYKLEWQQD